MGSERLSLQPTLRQLLKAEALSEAELLAGDDLDRRVYQVVSGPVSGYRDGTLMVIRVDLQGEIDRSAVKGLAGMILVKSVSAQALAGSGKAAPARSSISVDAEIDNLKRTCIETRTPLLLLPGLGGPVEIAEDIRSAYLAEVKRTSAHLHSRLVKTVIEEGLDGLVELVADILERPVALETAEFRLLAAAQNMSATPANQQRTLTEEVAEELNRQMRSQEDDTSETLEPVRLGRRLVSPIVLEGAVVAYLSVMLRSADDASAIAEYLRPAATACLVDFVQRRKEVSSATVTHRSLLKDLLSGYTLAASDQERLEQYFGFDICDGLLVFAVKTNPDAPGRLSSWTAERHATVEMEGANVIVVPFDGKQSRTWQDVAEDLRQRLAEHLGSLTLQIGAGRIAQTIMDLPDSYKEARQALITGSMIHKEQDFVLGYGDLGIKRILYLVIDHPELDRFYEETLAPLEAYDLEWETDLVPTLRVYLEQGYNLNSAAKELFVHRHTMRYRLEQIAELLKIDIDSPEVLLNLHIAFEIKDMKGTSRT